MSNYQLSKTGAEIDAALDLAITHEITKANVDGNYPDLTAGDAVHSTYADFASQIETDREIDDAEEACPPIVFGTVGGNAEVQSGLMKFPELRGHTIKWNQLVQNGNFANTDNWSASSGSFSVSDNVGTFTATATNGGISQDIAIKAGHKYLISAQIKLTSATTSVYLDLRHGGGLSNVPTQSTTNWQTVSGIISASDSNYAGYIRVRDGRSSSFDAVQIKNVQIFDITETDYTTVSEFVRDFPLPYYEYNAGTLLSSKSAALLSIGRNQWDEEWEVGSIDASTGEDVSSSSVIRSKNMIPVLQSTKYFFTCPAATGGRYYFYDVTGAFLSSAYISENNSFTIPVGAMLMRFTMASQYGTTYNHDICLYIYWETPNLPYVPYQQQRVTLPNIELRSAGTAYDVLYQQGGGKRRVGTVVLDGTGWDVMESGGHNVFYKSNATQKAYTANVICDRYATTNQGIGSSMPDKSITCDAGGGIALWIRDDSYASLDAFKTAIVGTVVYFELATETDIPTSENPGWDEYLLIDNFGTLIFGAGSSQVPQVPQAYFIRYTVNPVEFLDSVGEKAGWDADEIALKSDIPIPDAPTTDGTYTLKVTVSNGALIYSWVADEE